MKTFKSHLILLVFVFAFSLACAGSEKSPHATGPEEKHLWEYRTDHFNMYSVQDSIKIGETVQKQQMEAFRKKGLDVDSAKHAKLRSRLQRIMNDLAQVSDLPALPYEIHVYDKPDVVNAFALPGGKLGIFTGLFDPEKGLVDINSDDEIAAVLGHEISHATLRHVTRRLTTLSSVSILGNLATIALGQSFGGEWARVFSQVYSAGVNLYLPTYSRSHETEADQVGFYYMVKAGYDAQAAIRVWERAAQRAREAGKTDRTSFMATHPGSADRAYYLSGFLDDVSEVKHRMALLEEAKRP